MKSGIFRAACAAAILACGPAVMAAQALPPRVLVMPFAVQAEATGPNAALAVRWLGEAAATLLADELSVRGYAALPREDRVSVFARLHLPMSSELTRATMIRVAELIGATEIVYGDVQYGTDLAVRVRTIRLDTGQLLPEISERGELADIFGLFARLGAQVGERVRGTGAVAPAAAAVAPMPLPALESYIKGLMAAAPAAQQRFLESAMAQAPRDGRILTALWLVYADQGLHENALAVASAVPADAPQYRRARFDVALSLIELRRFDAAIKELTTLHAQQPASALSNALGIAELRRGAPPAGAEAAARYFERAAAEAPSETDYLFNLGYARALAGDSPGALSWLREAVRHDAADGDAHLVMGALLAAAGRSTEAQRELELARLLGTAIETVPATLTRVPPGLERLRMGLDDALLAAPVFAALAQRDQTETAGFYLARGRSFADQGRDREAMLDLQRSVYLAPYEDEPHLLLGRLYERAGRLGEAIDEFKVALWCRETAGARVALGRAFFESGDRDAARREFDRALVLAPDSAEVKDWLRKIGG
jgi:tetratricopeptide (TPR) repeat protein